MRIKEVNVNRGNRISTQIMLMISIGRHLRVDAPIKDSMSYVY